MKITLQLEIDGVKIGVPEKRDFPEAKTPAVRVEPTKRTVDRTKELATAITTAVAKKERRPHRNADQFKEAVMSYLEEQDGARSQMEIWGNVGGNTCRITKSLDELVEEGVVVHEERPSGRYIDGTIRLYTTNQKFMDQGGMEKPTE